MQFQTDRLRLREFKEDDWADTLAYQSTAEYQRFYPEVGRCEVDARSLVNRFIGWQNEQPRSRYEWAVILPDRDGLIGNCGLRKPAHDTTEAEIGCELAPDHWGRGYATELCRFLLHFGFGDLGLHRIYAHCLSVNDASTRLVEKLGLRPEGRLRETVWLRGRWCDTLLYGILEQEWRTLPVPP